MSETAFKFLLQHEGKPYFPSRCFVVADPTDNDRRQWTLELDEPQDAPWVHRIDDLKDWMLHGPQEMRQIIFDRKDPRTPYRNLERDEVFRAYLRKLLEKLPPEYQARRKYALMPSIADEKTRNRYKRAVEAAIPEITVLPEPEMVGEYFRLLKGTLELEEGQNNVLLVVDVGASTANMTIILSRRDGTIVDVDTKGAQRDLRLRALRGDSVGHAGRWVDLRVAEILKTGISDEVLREIEKAKIGVSLTGSTVSLDIPGSEKQSALSRETLASLSGELWNELRPLFERICERLYHNQLSSEDAKKKNRDRLKKLGVNGPADAHRLVNTVLLAGGTSLLPGFHEAMMETLFPGGQNPKVLHVGSSFAIAAAAGGLAHILQNYNPPRLHDYSPSREEVFSATLESTLPYALFLGVKQPGELEQQVAVLDANDPFVDDGGTRLIEGLPALARGSQPKMRLVPGLEAGVPARRGRQFKALNVRQSPGKMELKWDPIRERGHVISEHVEGTGHLWIDASKIRKRNEAVLEPFEGELEPGMLAVDGAEDVILDLGMSKIVAMTAQRGWTSAEELERVMRQGLKAEEMDQSDTVELAPISELESKFDTEIIRENVVDSGHVNAESSEIVPTPQKDRMLRKAETTPLAQVIADPGSREVSSQMASDSHGLATHHQDGWGDRVPDAVFSRSLESLRDFMKTEQPHFFFDDVVVVFLALAVRPLVLISGPPGCGKSTLVRIVAQMLGKTTGKNFHEVAVQAHWESDGVLFDEGGLLQALLHEHSHSHLVLFDEFNLTRPEYYLSRLFHALESGTGSFGNASKIAPCRVLGTLNIDDSSRPPSPKVIDRGFLLELSQVSWNVEAPSGIMNIKGCEPLPGLPMPTVGGAETDGNLAAVLEALNLAVQDNDLRHDLLPSRRVLSDIKAMLSLHHRLDLQAKNLLDRDELVDRIIASRILVKLSGAIDQLLPALVALEKTIEEVQELPRSRRRLKLARQQARLGFISPWQ